MTIMTRFSSRLDFRTGKVDMMHGAGGRAMAQLIEDLLNLSRVSRGALDLQELDMADLARRVVTDLRHREPGREVEVNIWEGMQARGDSRLLRAALENLIGNAWKFTSQAAHPRIEVGVLRDGNRGTFFVRDNGDRKSTRLNSSH